MTYDEWYDKLGHKLEDEIDSWIAEAPRLIDVNLIPPTQDLLRDAYESMESEYEDRCYDEEFDR